MSIKYGEGVIKKIPEEVILVEKVNPSSGDLYNQAYIVIEKDKRSMENALDWASRSFYNLETHDYDRIEPIVNTYKNGEFELTIKNSAEGSNQGGKLSFWNCIIKTPDEKELLIGISADSLLELLLENTFINGKCQNKIYLGRIGSRQAALTSNMQLFKEAQEEEIKKNKIKAEATTQYKPGDLVVTPTLKEIYLGEVSLPFMLSLDKYASCTDKVLDLKVYKEPLKVHIYADYFWWNDENRIYLIDIDSRVSKIKRCVSAELPDIIDLLKTKSVKDIVLSEIESNLEKRYIDRNGYIWNFMYKEALQYNPKDNLVEYVKSSMERCKRAVVERYTGRYGYHNFLFNVLNEAKK